MIADTELKNLLVENFPNWNLSVNKSGLALWASVNDGESSYFELQMTPSEGVGVSVIKSGTVDMSGHDEVFDTLEAAMEYLWRVSKSE